MLYCSEKNTSFRIPVGSRQWNIYYALYAAFNIFYVLDTFEEVNEFMINYKENNGDCK